MRLQIGYFDPEEAYKLDDWWSQQCCIKPVIEISRDKAMEQTTGSCNSARCLVLDSAWELTDDQPTAKVAFELKNMKDFFMAFQVSLLTCTACGELTVDCEQLW